MHGYHTFDNYFLIVGKKCLTLQTNIKTKKIMNGLTPRWKERLMVFQNALNRLTEVVSLRNQRPLNEYECDSLIKRFEFTYEMAWKLMMSYEKENGVEQILGSKDVIRHANSMSLIENGEAWTAGHWVAITAAEELVNDQKQLKVLGLTSIPWAYDGKYINTSNKNNEDIEQPLTLSLGTSANFQSTILNCAEGDVFTINGYTNNNSIRVWAFIDENNNVLELSDVSNGNVFNRVIVAPKNATKLILNNRKTSVPDAICYYGENYTLIKEEIKNARNDIEKCVLGVKTLFTIPGHIHPTGNITPDGETKYVSTQFIPVTAGDVLHYRLRTAGNFKMLAAFDKNKNLIEAVAGTNHLSEGIYTVVTDGYIRMSTSQAGIQRAYAYINDRLPDQMREYVECVPGYWQETLNNVLNKCYSLDMSVFNGDRFFFITDPHWGLIATNDGKDMFRLNCGHSSDLISYLARKTGINLVLCGGDIIRARTDTQASAMEELREYMQSFKNDKLRLLTVRGNHDTNATDQEIDEARINQKKLYNVIGRRMEEYAQVSPENLSFCYDNKVQKIRYIGFNCYGTNSNSNPTNDPNFDYNGLDPQYGILKWVGQKITEVPEYTIILLSHAYWGIPNITNNNEESGIVINNNSIVVKNYLLELKQQGAKIAAWFVGHCHHDMDTEVVGNNNVILRIISTRTDNAFQYNYLASYNYHDASDAMEPGTTTEQAFDIVYVDTEHQKIYAIRVGAGADLMTGDIEGVRTFEYTIPQ